MEEGENLRDVLLGYCAAVTCLLLMTVSVACVQGLQCLIPQFELNFCRYLVQVLLASLIAKIGKIEVRIELPDWGWIALLGIINMFFNVFVFSAVSLIPLTAAEAAINIAILISVAVLCRVLFGKSIGLVILTGMLLCVVGVICVSQPEIIVGRQTTDVERIMNRTIDDRCYDEFTSLFADAGSSNMAMVNSVMGYLLAASGGLSAALHYICAGILLKEHHPVTLIFWISLLGLPASLILAFYFEEPVIPTQTRNIILIFGHCLTGAVKVICSVFACQLIQPMRFASIRSLTTVAMLIPQYTVLKHILPGHGNWLEVFGAICISFGVALTPVFDLITLSYQSKEVWG